MANLQGSFFRDNSGGSVLTSLQVDYLQESYSDYPPLPCHDLGGPFCLNDLEGAPDFGVPEGRARIAEAGAPQTSLGGSSSGQFHLDYNTTIAGCGVSPGTTLYYQTCGGRIRFAFDGSWGNDPYPDYFPSAVFPAQFTQALADRRIALGLAFSAGDSDLRCVTASDYDASGLCGTYPSSTVPEPMTIALLGSGLAAMGGIGAVRRRRRQNEGT
jgi:hypothetical protein